MGVFNLECNLPSWYQNFPGKTGGRVLSMVKYRLTWNGESPVVTMAVSKALKKMVNHDLPDLEYHDLGNLHIFDLGAVTNPHGDISQVLAIQESNSHPPCCTSNPPPSDSCGAPPALRLK